MPSSTGWSQQLLLGSKLKFSVSLERSVLDRDGEAVKS
jgi:hypothetical protein